jgi:hypothetical protein
VKHFNTGSVRGWRFCNMDVNMTQELADKLTGLGFYHYARDTWHPEPLNLRDGSGQTFQVFVRGHEELLGDVPAGY